MKNYNKLSIFNNTKSVCLLTHIEPDTDALASCVVLRDLLKSFFKIPKVDIFAECSTLSETNKLILGNIHINKKISNYNTAVMIDCPNTERLGEYTQLFNNAKNKIVIDHHATNTYQGDINIVEIISSTCEIIYSICKHFKYTLNSKQKAKIYAGIITDTNNFTVGNITSKTFAIASEFEKEINRSDIYATFLNNRSLKNFQLLSLAIQNIVTFDHNQIIVTHITHEEAQKYKASFNDYYGIINQLATINSAKLICFIKPINNDYYVGMRAKNGLNVASIAKNFGGGGHTGAAAFVSSKSIQLIEQDILIKFRDELSKFKPKPTKLF